MIFRDMSWWKYVRKVAPTKKAIVEEEYLDLNQS